MSPKTRAIVNGLDDRKYIYKNRQGKWNALKAINYPEAGITNVCMGSGAQTKMAQ